MTQKELDVIQEKIGYRFSKPYLLTQAFTRKSFAEENQNWEDNEKLEFVGDKVLDFIIVKKLTQRFGFRGEVIAQSLESIKKGEQPSDANIGNKYNFEFVHSEGEMTEIKKQIVQTTFLSNAIEKLELEQFLIMSKGDVKNNVQNEPHVKEDLMEAIIGAVAIDSLWDISVLENVIEKMLNVTYYIENGVDDGIDYISYIQSWHQKEYGRAPNYVFYNVSNDSVFRCELELPGYSGAYFDGFGYSKKAAMRLTAKRAYEYLQKKKKTSNAIFEIIGEFDFENAISKLQMLQDKKIVTGLDYKFNEEAPTKESGGNPTWSCQCKIDGVDEFVAYIDAKKVEAKKASAYEMLQVLTGRNKIGELFETHGIMKVEID